MLRESISKNSLMLGFMAVLTTAIIAGVYLNTKTLIKENRRAAEERALLDIVPKSRHNNAMLNNFVLVDNETLLSLREQKKIYIARQDNNAVAVIIPATARDGYTGDIDIIVGINVDGTVAGVRVLAHRETPGLGDKVDIKKSNWVNGFIGHSLINPGVDKWKVKKDKGVFDQFTGATVTPRAVTKAVLQALQYFEQHRHEILPPEEASSKKSEDLNNG
jgi:electron transport complex protein RnfG